jgi:GT2 family glycosyltransferase
LVLVEGNLTISGSERGQTGVPGLVYVIILNYNGAQMTLDCVRSTLNLDYPNFRVLVVDNASTDDSVARFKEAFTDPRLELLVNSANEGYAGGNNRGIEMGLTAGADYILVLNNDTIADQGCLRPLVDAMEADPQLGICGGPTFNLGPGADINYGQRISLYTSKTAVYVDGNQAHDVDFCNGANLLLRAEALRRIGMFDERFFLICEDSDICFRARQAGYGVRFIPGPGVKHLQSATLKQRSLSRLSTFCAVRNPVWFVRRHGRLKHRIVFHLLNLVWCYPRHIMGRLACRQFSLLGPVLRGIWQGYFRYPGDYMSH